MGVSPVGPLGVGLEHGPAMDNEPCRVAVVRAAGPEGVSCFCAHFGGFQQSVLAKGGASARWHQRGWRRAGIRTVANARVHQMLADYAPPDLAPAMRDAGVAYVTNRSVGVPDSVPDLTRLPKWPPSAMSALNTVI